MLPAPRRGFPCAEKVTGLVEYTRRDFLQRATDFTVGAACGQALLAAAEPDPGADSTRSGSRSQVPNAVPPVQIGILLATFRRESVEERLDTASACGLECVQVSMDCANLPAMPDQIPDQLAVRIRREAAARGIAIASVQGTFNMSHPEAEHRRTGLRRLRVLAEACAQMGTSKIHVCTGTRDRDNMWRRHPENDSPQSWRDMVSCMRDATGIAREANVVLAFEPEVNNVVDSAVKARRLLDEIGSPHLKVTGCGAGAREGPRP
jgi:sugar phosphate isomerase/epimerase